MPDTRLTELLAIDHPILQAGAPWVSNPELVAAVSEAEALGILHPSAGMKPHGDMVDNLRENIRRVRRLTSSPFVSRLLPGKPRGILAHRRGPGRGRENSGNLQW